MNPPNSEADEAIAGRTRLRVWVHIVPYLFFLYILAYLDRVNISVAQLEMARPPAEGGLGLSLSVIGWAAGIFFWGYPFLEIPSTISVVKWGARWVFARILVLWGICASLCGFLGLPFLERLLGWVPAVGENPAHQLYLLRFLLGFFEGGFFPSVIVYLGLWFRPQDRAKAIATFMAAIPISSAVGQPLSGLLLNVRWLDLPGWRWVFILEGILPVAVGFLTLFFLPDRPEKARWLPPDECAWLRGELDREEGQKRAHGFSAWRSSLGMVLLLTLVYFCLNVSSYGLSMFMPAIIKSQLNLPPEKNWLVSMIASLPYACAFVLMLLNGWHSDRSHERIWHVAVPLFIQGSGIAAAAFTSGLGKLPALIMILWVGSFLYAHLPAFWPIPSTFLGTVVAASAIGFINMIGNLGGFVGPALVGGSADQWKGNYGPALWILAPFPIAGGILILFLDRLRRSLAASAKEGVEGG